MRARNIKTLGIMVWKHNGGGVRCLLASKDLVRTPIHEAFNTCHEHPSSVYGGGNNEVGMATIVIRMALKPWLVAVVRHATIFWCPRALLESTHVTIAR